MQRNATGSENFFTRIKYKKTSILSNRERFFVQKERMAKGVHIARGSFGGLSDYNERPRRITPLWENPKTTFSKIRPVSLLEVLATAT